MKAANGRMGNFDLLRLFLALWVLVHHTTAHLVNFTVVPAVAIFVCLSGFLIPSSLKNSRSWQHFAWKRALRVVPVLILSFALVAILFPEKVAGTFWFYVTAGLAPTALTRNGPLWTLMVEEVLYAGHVTFRRWFSLPTVSLTFALFVGLTYGLYSVGEGLWGIRAGLASCFLAGNLIALLKPKFHWGFSAIGLLAASVLAYQVHPAFVIPVQAMLFLLLSLTLPQICWRLPDFSYSLYALHAPFMFLYRGMGLGIWEVTAYTLLSLSALCPLSWYLIERPALALKDRQLMKDRGWEPQPQEVNSTLPSPQPAGPS